MPSPAAAYIESLIRSEPRVRDARERRGLAPMEELLRRLGAPHRGLRCVHIAGSKGKGSTALLAEAALEGLGIRTGTYTSPHLEEWTERFRIEGRPISEDRLNRTIERVRPQVEGLTHECPELAPSFFDVLSAAALLLFRDARIDCAILETGLGGRLDSTNVVRPAVTCITTIEREHTARLGNEISGIAREKAGIVKPGIPLVLGRVPAAAESVIRARAREVEAEVFGLDAELGAKFVTTKGGCLLRMPAGGGQPLEVELRHPAPFLAHNAALALACVDRLGLLCAPRARERAAHAVAAATLPGRAEILACAPFVVVDGAHTRESAAALSALLDSLAHDAMDLVVSLGADKEAGEVLPELLARARRVYATTAEPSRSLPAETLAQALRELAPALPVRSIGKPASALREALRPLAARDLLCITGSMYLAGAARRILREELSGPPCTPMDRASTIADSQSDKGPQA